MASSSKSMHCHECAPHFSHTEPCPAAVFDRDGIERPCGCDAT